MKRSQKPYKVKLADGSQIPYSFPVLNDAIKQASYFQGAVVINKLNQQVWPETPASKGN